MGIVSDTYSAKANLSRLLDRVEAGEEVTITRRGRAVAKLVPVHETPQRLKPVVFGLLAGKLPPLPADMGEDAEWQALMDIMTHGEPPAA
jgi:prevent-host-death family protein